MENNISIEYCIEKLELLQKCNRNPKDCKHDYNEHGEQQSFDSATIDQVLEDVIAELKRTSTHNEIEWMKNNVPF